MERVGWWVGEVTVETKVSCRAGHTTQAPDPEKKRQDPIRCADRAHPTTSRWSATPPTFCSFWISRELLDCWVLVKGRQGRLSIKKKSKRTRISIWYIVSTRKISGHFRSGLEVNLLILSITVLNTR